MGGFGGNRTHFILVGGADFRSDSIYSKSFGFSCQILWISIFYF